VTLDSLDRDGVVRVARYDLRRFAPPAIQKAVGGCDASRFRRVLLIHNRRQNGYGAVCMGSREGFDLRKRLSHLRLAGYPALALSHLGA